MAKKESDSDRVLREFMQEHFPYAMFKKIGYFTKEMRGDYKAQASRVCLHFGYETVFEYGTKEVRCHLSYGSGTLGIDSERPLHVNNNGELKEEPFITVFESWLNK